MKVFKDISNKKVVIVLFSQSLTLFVSLIMTIGVTKALGVTNYGYWQLFLLYLSYTGLFHLGVYDGIYLKYGGMKIEELDHNEIRSVFWFTIAFQLCFLVIFYIFYGLTENFQKDIVTAVLITGFINNVQYFLYFILLATNNINRYSFSVIIEKLFLTISILLFIHFDYKNYFVLVYIYIFGKLLSLINLFSFFTFLFKISFVNVTSLILSFLKVGFLLMFSNIINALILGLPRIVIEKKWSIDVFGKVSLAFSIVYFIIAILSQLSLILFPLLRNKDFIEQKSAYVNLKGRIARILMVSILLYFPFITVFSKFLPKYEYSFFIFTYLLPIVLFDGLTQILYTSFFKTLNLQAQLFKINLITIVITIILLFTSYYLVNNILVFLLISVFAVLVKSFLCNRIISSIYKLEYVNSFLFELLYSIFIVIIFNHNNNLLYVISFGTLSVWLHFTYFNQLDLGNKYEK